jgi:hypothetical protein
MVGLKLKGLIGKSIASEEDLLRFYTKLSNESVFCMTLMMKEEEMRVVSKSYCRFFSQPEDSRGLCNTTAAAAITCHNLLS